MCGPTHQGLATSTGLAGLKVGEFEFEVKDVGGTGRQHVSSVRVWLLQLLPTSVTNTHLPLLLLTDPTPVSPPTCHTGTPAQIQAEISRLTARLKTLQDGEAAVAAIKPDPALDPDGSRLATMLEWRQQRKAAIVREIPRLRRQAARFEQAQNAWGSSKVAAAPAAAASSAGGASGLEAANSELLQWLEANGATVSVRSLFTKLCQGCCSQSVQWRAHMSSAMINQQLAKTCPDTPSDLSCLNYLTNTVRQTCADTPLLLNTAGACRVEASAA